MKSISFDAAALDAAIPMALVFDADGTVIHVGPTFEKICPGQTGRNLFGVIRLIHPDLGDDLLSLRQRVNRKLRLDLRAEAGCEDGEEPTVLRGAITALANGKCLLHLSFGADPVGALTRHRLTARDFVETDPMVDLLYLIEAHSMVLSEFQKLGDRLDDALVAAEEAAATDKLTGLHNRRAMDAHLGMLAVRDGPAFGLMHLDLDYFKAVNDTLGHAAGDRVLEVVATILREEVRQSDMVARVGGDEFMLIFDDCTDVELLRFIANRIIHRLEEPIDWNGMPCRVSASIGITMSHYYDKIDTDRLVSDADEALYQSKREGRARHSTALPNARADLEAEDWIDRRA